MSNPADLIKDPGLRAAFARLYETWLRTKATRPAEPLPLFKPRGAR